MSLPRLDQLQRVIALSRQIESLKQNIAALNDRLQKQSIANTAEIDAYAQHIRAKLQQHANGEAFREAIEQFNQQESSYISGLSRTITSSVSEFVSHAEYESIVIDLMNSIACTYPGSEILVYSPTGSLKLDFAAQQGVRDNAYLLIVDEDITYDISPDVVAVELTRQLLTTIPSSKV